MSAEQPKKRSIMTMTQLQSPDLAVAKAIDNLSAKTLTLEMLSNLSENDVPRLTVMLTVGQDPDMDAGFLTSLAYNELALMCSVTMKRGGIRSEQIVDVAKSPPMLSMDSNPSIMDKIRGRLRR